MDIIFKESSTFGLRFYKVEREVLERSFEKMNTDVWNYYYEDWKKK